MQGISARTHNNSGWTSFDDYPRLVGDVNGDGKADIVGFKDEGTWVALSDGSEFGSKELWLGWFAHDTAAGDWETFGDYPRFLADMNGDGMADIVGYKSPGVYVSLSAKDRFLPPTLWLTGYVWGDYWGNHPRFVGDLTGDGRAEVGGIATDGPLVHGHHTYLDFSYDANGAMVSAVISDTGGLTTTIYIGDHDAMEALPPLRLANWQSQFASDTQWLQLAEGQLLNETARRFRHYYFHNGRRVAMRTGNDVSFLHADHLQSTSNTTGDEASGTQYYYPYGGNRGTNEVATDYRYTGQRWQAALGLYYYRARWYDPQMRRFVQADSIVPEPGNPQSLNRYAYANNSPVRYNDPSGHATPIDLDASFLVRHTSNGQLRVVQGGDVFVNALEVKAANVALGAYEQADDLAQWAGGPSPALNMIARSVREGLGGNTVWNDCGARASWQRFDKVPITGEQAVGAVAAGMILTAGALSGHDGSMAPTRFVSGVKIEDKRTGNVFEGTVDLQPTFDRIEQGIGDPHYNDGELFRNSEGILPHNSNAHYYTEWVIRTPGIDHVGPQRLVTGLGGEAYYTYDHYEHFIQVR